MIKKPNVIFIVVDALRPDHLSGLGYKRKTSPNINNLIKNGIYFQNHFSTNGTTDNSFLSYLSGRHILKDQNLGVHACDGMFYTEKEIKSFFDSNGIFLQEIFKKNGYKTYCLKHLHGYQKRGFDYYFKETFIEGKKVKQPLFRNLFRNQKKLFKILQKIYYFYHSNFLYLKVLKIKKRVKKQFDERATNKAIDIIKNNKKKENFFMIIDYVYTHTPYNPGKFMYKFKDDNSSITKWITARYDESIFYTDYLIGKFLKALNKERLSDNTIICFLSDHGESLGEHGIYFDHHGIYDSSFRVPLIIAGKNLPKKKINTLTLHQDIPPTILDLVGIKYDKIQFDGESLVPLIKNKNKKIRDSFILEEYLFARKIAIRTGGYKYSEAKSKKDARCINCNKIHGGVIELYNLKKDPEEKINIAKENEEILIKIKKELNKKIKEIKILNEKRRVNKILSKI